MGLKKMVFAQRRKETIRNAAALGALAPLREMSSPSIRHFLCKAP